MRPGEISSDDEPLVPGASRNVFPRVSIADSVADVTQVDQESSGAMPMTVLATPEDLVQVGREVPFDRPPSGPHVAGRLVRDLGVSCPRTDERHHEEAQVDQVDVDETPLDDESVVSRTKQTRSRVGCWEQCSSHTVFRRPCLTSAVDCGRYAVLASEQERGRCMQRLRLVGRTSQATTIPAVFEMADEIPTVRQTVSIRSSRSCCSGASSDRPSCR